MAWSWLSPYRGSTETERSGKVRLLTVNGELRLHHLLQSGVLLPQVRVVLLAARIRLVHTLGYFHEGLVLLLRALSQVMLQRSMLPLLVGGRRLVVNHRADLHKVVR